MRQLFAALLFSCLCTSVAGALPTPNGHVNDFANLMSPTARQALEAELRGFERSSTMEIAVVILETLDGRPIEEYAIDLATTWGIGKRHRDSGLLFLIAVNDRQMRIEVGRGLEGQLTDLKAGRILKNVVAPKLRSGDFDTAIQAGVRELILELSPEAKAEVEQHAAFVKAEQIRALKRAGDALLVGLVLTGMLLGFVAVWRRKYHHHEAKRQNQAAITAAKEAVQLIRRRSNDFAQLHDSLSETFGQKSLQRFHRKVLDVLEVTTELEAAIAELEPILERTWAENFRLKDKFEALADSTTLIPRLQTAADKLASELHSARLTVIQLPKQLQTQFQDALAAPEFNSEWTGLEKAKLARLLISVSQVADTQIPVEQRDLLSEEEKLLALRSEFDELKQRCWQMIADIARSQTTALPRLQQIRQTFNFAQPADEVRDVFQSAERHIRRAEDLRELRPKPWLDLIRAVDTADLKLQEALDAQKAEEERQKAEWSSGGSSGGSGSSGSGGFGGFGGGRFSGGGASLRW